MARAREGDAAAFGMLVDRHRMAVYRAARAVLNSHADAEDAAQEAFLAAYRRLDSFRGAASFKTWLLTIAWNEAINRRRSLTRIWRRQVGHQSDDEGPDLMANVEADGPTPEQAASHEDLRRGIRRAIEALSPKLRDVLLLAQSGEHTYDEIGAMLGVPTGTIKWRVSEARKIVKQTLRKDGFNNIVD
ncbi:MAG: RNA polymerase sigma factor [Acidobacteriia bacterium]|nr:RNA polymerase sigma factor [Terriglobia bacterium]